MNKFSKAVCKLAYAINHPRPPKYVIDSGEWPERSRKISAADAELEDWFFKKARQEQEFIECQDNWDDQFELEYRAGIRDAFLDAIEKLQEIREFQVLDIPNFLSRNNDEVEHPVVVREMLAAAEHVGGDAA